MKRCTLVVIAMFAASSTGAADWTQFRGPRGDGVVREARFPERWDEQTNVAWKVPLPGKGVSSPIVVGGKVYVQSASDDGPRWRRYFALTQHGWNDGLAMLKDYLENEWLYRVRTIQDGK